MPELVYMEVFVTFDQELDSNERNIQTDNFENLTQLKLRIINEYCESPDDLCLEYRQATLRPIVNSS